MFLIEDQFFFLDSYDGELVAMAPYKGSKLDARSGELLSAWSLALEHRLRQAKEEVVNEEMKVKEECEARRLKKEMKKEEKKRGRLAAEMKRLERRQQEDSNVDSGLRRRCREGNDAFIAGYWRRLNLTPQ